MSADGDPIVGIHVCDHCQKVCRTTLVEIVAGLRVLANRYLCDRCRDQYHGLWPDLPAAPLVTVLAEPSYGD